MVTSPPPQNVTAYRLTPAIAQKRVREIAATTDLIRWSLHALERMVERDIFDVDVLRALRHGMICGNPERGQNEGEWKCKMTMRIRGTREIGVVAIILRTDGLFVKTVEWEDLP